MKALRNEFRIARIKALAYGVAIALAIVPAALFYFNEKRHIESEAFMYSRVICERIELAIAENPQLWQYAVPKLTEIARDNQWFPQIEAISVYDNQSRLIHREEAARSFIVKPFLTQHLLYYKSDLIGYIQLENRLEQLVLWTALIFFVGSLGGGFLGYEIYAKANRLNRFAEQQSIRAFAKVIQANEWMEDMANRDCKTGINTITYFSKVLMNLFENPDRKVAVLLLDIDFFRIYNEKLGHENGDIVLRDMASMLRRELRAQDIIGRFGGEEFIIALPDLGSAEAVNVANQLRIAVQDHEFEGAEFLPKGRVTISIGVSSTETAPSVQELFYQLDSAVYKAKCAGRNCAFAFEVSEIEIDSVNFSHISPQMKAEVTVKFIKKFFQGTSSELFQFYDPTILAFLKALEIWDAETVQHSLRVNRIAMAIGKELDLPMSDRLTLNLGTLLHDIGKLTIGDTILIKPGALTNDEYELMKNHPRIGYDLVSDNPGLRKASDVILMHHEWVNGSGYPQGLEGTQIPLLARICTVADSMDAMMTDRPYREGKKESEVRSELTKHKGIQFDPEIVDIVLSLDWQQFYNPLGSPVISAVGTVPPVGLSEFDSV